MTFREIKTRAHLLGSSGFFVPLLACSGVLAGASLTPAIGQATASWVELQEKVKAGDAVVVLAEDGRRVRADVLQISNTALSLRVGRANEIFPIERIREVSVARNDRLWNGLLIGVAGGALGGLIPDHFDDCDECHDSLYGSIAVGAGAGLILDALIRKQTLVYRASGAATRISLGIQTKGYRTAVVLSVRF